METGIGISNKDRCLQCFDLTFDVSVQSFLVPLCKGACVYTVPHDQIKYSYVYSLMEEHELTFGAMAPSMIRYLQPYFDEINVPSMRYNILTAEASPLDLINEWSRCIPNAEIYDFYGPTEATIYCTVQKFHRDRENKQLNGMLSIGKPMPGVDAVIVDEKFHILGKNHKGELCVAGNQLTPGYWKNPKKNNEAFVEIMYDGRLVRFYRTGDSCYVDEEDDIMLAGRIDHQVKIQGYRIELGEIEFHARDYLKGQNVVACTFENEMNIAELALFVEGNLDEKKKISGHMESKLPSYMVPSVIMAVESFPINTSGKVDRMLLKKKLEKQFE